MLTICGGYQLMGSYYKTNSGVAIKNIRYFTAAATIFKSDKRMIGKLRYMTEWGEVKALKPFWTKHFDDKINCILLVI